MADEEAIKNNRNTGKQNAYFTKLDEFAQICCRNTGALKRAEESVEESCKKLQLSYWVYSETNKAMNWNDFTPTEDRKGQLTTTGMEMCGIIPSTNPDYPLFSYNTGGKADDHRKGAHSEAQLLPRMIKRAREQRKATSFFLWTKNSPCGNPTRSDKNHDCQNKIFNFVATSLVKKRHRLDVGFRKWHAVTTEREMPRASTEQRQLEDRKRFCEEIESQKNVKYKVQGSRSEGTIDFRPYLGFWKIKNQVNIKNQEREPVSDNKYISSIDKMYC